MYTGLATKDNSLGMVRNIDVLCVDKTQKTKEVNVTMTEIKGRFGTSTDMPGLTEGVAMTPSKMSDKPKDTPSVSEGLVAKYEQVREFETKLNVKNNNNKHTEEQTCGVQQYVK